jgi:small subunit ribosomal protein S11
MILDNFKYKNKLLTDDTKSLKNKIKIIKQYRSKYKSNIIRIFTKHIISKIKNQYGLSNIYNPYTNYKNYDNFVLVYDEDAGELRLRDRNLILNKFITSRLKYILLKNALNNKRNSIRKSILHNKTRYSNYRFNKEFYPVKSHRMKVSRYKTLTRLLRFTEKSLRYYMGIVYVLITNNNTFINIKTRKVNLLRWINAGSYGYKNAQKSSFFAAENIAIKFGKLVKYTYKINNIIVKIKGFRGSRRNVIKGLKKAKLSIYKYEDITPFAHNGCRKKKKRRL